MNIRTWGEFPLILVMLAMGGISLSLAAADDTASLGLDGTWTYRSLRNNPSPDIVDWRKDLRFAEGLMTFDVSGRDLTGTLFGGTKYEVALKGWIAQGNPITLRFQGRGKGELSKKWVYDYHGFYVPSWPEGVDQRPAIVGSVIRSEPHGEEKLGIVASFILLRQDDPQVSDKSDKNPSTERISPDEIGLESAVRTVGMPFAGKNAVVLFIRGGACGHCNEQLAKFTERQADFARIGVQLFCVSPDLIAETETVGEAGLVEVISDPHLKLYRQFDLMVAGTWTPLHGTFILDKDGKVRWANRGQDPFMNVDQVLEKARR